MYAEGKIHKQIALISTETTPGRLIGQSDNFVSKETCCSRNLNSLHTISLVALQLRPPPPK